MKTFFSLVNFVVGILSLLIGVGNFLFLTNNPSGIVAGGVAVVVGTSFLWLATTALFSNPRKS